MAKISDLVKELKIIGFEDSDNDYSEVFHLILNNEHFTQEKIIEVLEILLDRDVTAHIKNKEHKTVLQLAINNRLKDVVDFLLRRKINIESVAHFFVQDEYIKFAKLSTKQDNSCICTGEIEGMEIEGTGFLEWLMLKEIDFDCKNDENQRALVLAIERNLQHLLPVLLRKTKIIDFVDDRNRTLLHLFLEAKDNYCGISKNWYSKRYETDIVKTLLSRGVSADAEDNYKCTPIRIAISKKEDIDTIGALLRSSKNVNHKNSEGETLFHMVIRKWATSKESDTEYYMKISRTCVAKGAYVNEPDKQGITAAFHAIESYNLRIIEFLRKNGADFSVFTTYGDTLMHMLISHKHFMNVREEEEMKLYELLMDSLTIKHHKNLHGETLFQILIRKWVITDKVDNNDAFKGIARALIANGADVNEADKFGATPAYHAFAENNLCAVEFLRDNGADFGVTVNKEFLIHMFIESKDFDSDETEMKLFDLLLEDTTNVNLKNSNAETVFAMVIKKWVTTRDANIDYYMKIAKLLIAKGADVNERNNYGMTPLGYAVKARDLLVVELLRENGADFNATTVDGRSLMHLLVFKLNDEIGNEANILFNMLICNGVSVSSRNSKKETPLIYMFSQSFDPPLDIAKLLLEHGADINAKDFEGYTALHKAAAYRRKLRNVGLFLLKHGADFNARTQAGYSVVRLGLCLLYNDQRAPKDQVKPNAIPRPSLCIRHDITNNDIDILLTHWIKLDAANLKCHTDDDYNDLLKLRKYKRYYEKCSEEIKILRQTFIDSSASLYDFLHTYPNSCRAYINNEKLQQLLRSPNFDEEFPEYAVLIWASYHQAVTRKTLLEPAKMAWSELTNIHLPDICIERVFSFVSNSDMFDIIGQ